MSARLSLAAYQTRAVDALSGVIRKVADREHIIKQRDAAFIDQEAHELVVASETRQAGDGGNQVLGTGRNAPCNQKSSRVGNSSQTGLAQHGRQKVVAKRLFWHAEKPVNVFHVPLEHCTKGLSSTPSDKNRITNRDWRTPKAAQLLLAGKASCCCMAWGAAFSGGASINVHEAHEYS